MDVKFFSDREKGVSSQINERISYSISKGIISVCNQYKVAMSFKFPKRCPDNELWVIGFDENAFNEMLYLLIPNFKFIERANARGKDELTESDQYTLLDYIEFCMENIVDYVENDYHPFFSHYHLSFKPHGMKYKTEFCDNINRIFQRNGIAFRLSLNNGSIERILPTGLDQVIKNYNVTSSDVELNNLIDLAIQNICKPKIEDRQVALEKLWDAFERIKTIKPGKKNISADSLINSASENSTEFFKLLKTEFDALTKIGNEKLRIRHHETDKVSIDSIKHIDYLFYRMMSLLTLLVNYIE